MLTKRQNNHYIVYASRAGLCCCVIHINAGDERKHSAKFSPCEHFLDGDKTTCSEHLFPSIDLIASAMCSQNMCTAIRDRKIYLHYQHRVRAPHASVLEIKYCQYPILRLLFVLCFIIWGTYESRADQAGALSILFCRLQL